AGRLLIEGERPLRVVQQPAVEIVVGPLLGVSGEALLVLGQDVLTVTEGDLGILIFAVSRNAGIRAGQPLAGIREGLLEALAGPQGTEPIGMGRRRAGLGGEDAAKGVV